MVSPSLWHSGHWRTINRPAESPTCQKQACLPLNVYLMWRYFGSCSISHLMCHYQEQAPRLMEFTLPLPTHKELDILSLRLNLPMSSTSCKYNTCHLLFQLYCGTLFYKFVLYLQKIILVVSPPGRWYKLKDSDGVAGSDASMQSFLITSEST